MRKKNERAQGDVRQSEKEEIDLKWNVYSSYGPPSVLIGIGGIENKVELSSKHHNKSDIEIEEALVSFEDAYIEQNKQLRTNWKYLLASFSMAGFCFSMTGLQYFFTDYIFTAINVPETADSPPPHSHL